MCYNADCFAMVSCIAVCVSLIYWLVRCVFDLAFNYSLLLGVLVFCLFVVLCGLWFLCLIFCFQFVYLVVVWALEFCLDLFYLCVYVLCGYYSFDFDWLGLLCCYTACFWLIADSMIWVVGWCIMFGFDDWIWFVLLLLVVDCGCLLFCGVCV